MTLRPAARPSRLTLSITLSLAAAWTASAAGMLTVGSDSLRLAAVFQTDEALHVNMLANALRTDSMRLVFGSYGHLYFNLALVPLHAWNQVQPVTEAQILLVLRSLSFLFAGATIVITGAWAASHAGAAAGFTAGLLLVLSPLLAEWATLSHPDTAQVFFLMLSLYLVARLVTRVTPRRVAEASAAAGLAFACKYSGMFVLPLIATLVVRGAPPVAEEQADRMLRRLRWLVAAGGVAAVFAGAVLEADRLVAWLAEDGRVDVPGAEAAVTAARRGLAIAGAAALLLATLPLWRRRPSSARLLGVGASLGLCAVAFLAAFTVTSPYSWRKLAFLKGLYFESARLAAAVPLTTAAAEWGQVAADHLGVVLLAGAAAGLAAGWLLSVPSKTAEEKASLLTLAAWIAIYSVLLVARLRAVTPHYALPLVPALAWFAGYGAARIAATMRASRTAAAGALSALLVLSSAPRYIEWRGKWMRRVELSASVAGGRWLACALAPTARIAYDQMSFVPPVFTDVHPTWGGTIEWRDTLGPDVVIVRSAVERMHADASASQAERVYYDCLRKGACGFEPWFGNDEVQVYGRRERAANLLHGGSMDAARRACGATPP